ncbi:MAG: nucleotide sugar dehydrogenase [Verrucomicrobiota bacterium]|nr:nucleotide sugar dehydrogenase [Verrucomicrobiota bacterium]
MVEKDVCIIGGCGHVGFPLALAFADAGKTVEIFDINEKTMSLAKQGQLPFKEEGAEIVLREVLEKKLLTFSSKPESISNAKYIIMVIGTPVDEHLNPRFNEIKDVINKYLQYFKDGQTLILRSTIFPGISEKINNTLKKTGKNINVAFCPERIAEGKALEELKELPQIISGFSETALDHSRELFSSLTKDILELEPIEAELAKLFNNVWRYISFSISNQFLMMANDYDIDFYKIYNAMTYKYPRAKNFPKAGFAAGPCLFKDTMQLGAFNNNNFFLGHAAMLVNEGLPNYIVNCLKKKMSIKDKTVGILGMAFKAESDDKRESLSYKLRKILDIECKRVLCSDVYIKGNDFVSTEELIKKSDIIIIGTPHNKYKSLNISNTFVVDIWNIYNKGVFSK